MRPTEIYATMKLNDSIILETHVSEKMTLLRRPERSERPTTQKSKSAIAAMQPWDCPHSFMTNPATDKFSTQHKSLSTSTCRTQRGKFMCGCIVTATTNHYSPRISTQFMHCIASMHIKTTDAIINHPSHP